MSNPWDDFRPVRQEPKKDGILTRVLVSLFIVAICSVLMGGAVVFFYPGARYGNFDAMISDTPEKMKTRVLIGAGIGAVIGVVSAIEVQRRLNRK